jgi:hypothetical protein
VLQNITVVTVSSSRSKSRAVFLCVCVCVGGGGGGSIYYLSESDRNSISYMIWRMLMLSYTKFHIPVSNGLLVITVKLIN